MKIVGNVSELFKCTYKRVYEISVFQIARADCVHCQNNKNLYRLT